MADDDNTLETGETEELEHEDGNGQLSNRMTRLEENSAALALLADPDVQNLLKLKNAGKTVKLIEDAGETEQVEEVDPAAEAIAGLEADDPLRKHYETVNKMLSVKEANLQKKLDQLNQRMDSVESVAGDVARKGVKEQVESAKSKYKDFGQYSKQMIELANKVQGLSVEELYVLAKQRSGKLKLSEGSTHSEKPTSQPARITTKKPGAQARPPGRAGFKSFLAEALGTIPDNSQE